MIFILNKYYEIKRGEFFLCVFFSVDKFVLLCYNANNKFIQNQEVFILEQAINAIISFATEYGLKIVGALLFLVIGLNVSKLLVKLIIKSKGFQKLSEDVRKFASSAIGFIFKLVVILSFVAILGVPMASILALLGTAGVAIGLGLQGSLGNFAGGIILMIFRPFHVGDFIDTGSYAGTVEEIGIYYTYLRTTDNSRVVIPNSVSSNLSFKDVSTHETRRVDFTFSVDYSSDIETVKKIILETAEAHDLVMKDPAPFARLVTHNASSLDFACRVWCKNSDYSAVYFDLNEQVKKAFDANGISIPFPQMDVHVKQ